MNSRNCATFLAVLFVFCGVADARPPDYAITFEIHETVGEPTSDVDFTVTMGLMKEEQDGDDIGWDIVVITIREMDGSTVVETWFTTTVNIDTPDNLWWITHDDPDNPVNSVFVVTPLISGSAGHVNPTELTLDFDFEGEAYVGTPPYNDTSSVTILLQEDDDPPPASKKDQSNEPAKIPNLPQEPFPS